MGVIIVICIMSALTVPLLTFLIYGPGPKLFRGIIAPTIFYLFFIILPSYFAAVLGKGHELKSGTLIGLIISLVVLGILLDGKVTPKVIQDSSYTVFTFIVGGFFGGLIRRFQVNWQA